MSVSTTAVTTTYDQSGPGGAIPGNIIQTVAASEGTANNEVTSPLTSAAVNPSAVAIGTSNQPLNAKPVAISALQITANGTSYLSVISNPA